MSETVGTRDRRGFIIGAAAASVAAIGAGAGLRSLVGSEGGTGSIPAIDLDHDLLAPLVGERLEFATALGAVTGIVSSVSEPRSFAAGEIAGSTFSVLIRAGERIAQDTYQVRHARLGTFPLFVVPVGLPAGSTHIHEAIFSRRD